MIFIEITSYHGIADCPEILMLNASFIKLIQDTRPDGGNFTRIEYDDKDYDDDSIMKFRDFYFVKEYPEDIRQLIRNEYKILTQATLPR